ncbi:MAG: hypothetical protein EU531_08520 [Promethearchaeota archaeon]|nr:MAG: hypothetical protein EU531_08520 [Candidatus Lokiarchaeota archaeon]
MLNLTGLSVLIGYIIVSVITIVSIIQILRNRKRYGTELNMYLNVATIFNGGIIFSTFFLFSILFYISDELSIFLWKGSIITGFISLIINAIIYSFFKKYRKVQSFPFLYLAMMFGLLIGILLLPGSIELSIQLPDPIPLFLGDPSLVTYYFDIFTGIIIILFQLTVIMYIFYISLRIHLEFKNKAESLPLVINSIIYFLPTFMYILYIVTQTPIYRELYISLIWITYFAVDIVLIAKPELFFILPNKIYAVNIYHKSGILLYSYKFQKESEFQDDSKIWGNVLVGLNYILSEFTEKSDKIELIKTKNSDILVLYENKGGYAVMISTNKKNAIVEDLSQKFSEEFGEKYNTELNEIQDLNKIINVAEFDETKNLIEKTFQLYL